METRNYREKTIVRRERKKQPQHSKVVIIKPGITMSKEPSPNLYIGASYPKHWNAKLKAQIRERDGNKCTLCSYPFYLNVHHIDYNKANCDPLNLVTLCSHCHLKTNNHRHSWYRMLSERMRAKYYKV